MERRKRYWYCEGCGKLSRRYKKQNTLNGPHCCSVPMTSCRTTKKAHKIRSRHFEKIRKNSLKISNFKEKYYSKVRNSGGKVLKISPETKQLWKEVVKAKTRPNIIRKAQVWVKSLEKDSRNIKENDWARSLLPDGTISKQKGGWSAPIIQQKRNSGEWGSFRAGITYGGCFINIHPERNGIELKETLRHEILHYLDSLSGTPCDEYSSGRYWKKRLEWMERKFKLK